MSTLHSRASTRGPGFRRLGAQLAAVFLALPLSGLWGGIALAGDGNGGEHGSANAAGDAGQAKDDGRARDDGRGNNGGGNNGGGNKNGKVTICHATGSASNPFVVITPNKSGVVHGHAKHGDDIIPPFSYNDHGVTRQFPGLNWTAANQVIYARGCSVPAGGITRPVTVGTAGGGTRPITGGTAGGGTRPITVGIAGGGTRPITGGTAGGGARPITVGIAGGGTRPITGGTAGEATGGAPQPGVVFGPVVAASGPIVTVTGPPTRTVAARPTALPFTGFDPTVPVGLSLILLGVGVGVTGASRRQQLI